MTAAGSEAYTVCSSSVVGLGALTASFYLVFYTEMFDNH